MNMKRTEVFEGERAQKYDCCIRKWFPDYDSLLKLIFPLLASQLKGNVSRRILVVGSGTGNELNLLARLRPDWFFVGVDPSGQMNNIALAKVGELCNVKIIDGTIEDVAGSFDAATCLLVTHFYNIEDKMNILQNIYDLLHPGGTLILADSAGSGVDLETNLESLRTFWTLELPGEHLDNGVEHIKNTLYHIDEDKLTSILHLLGFKTVTRFFQWLIYHAWLIRK